MLRCERKERETNLKSCLRSDPSQASRDMDRKRQLPPADTRRLVPTIHLGLITTHRSSVSQLTAEIRAVTPPACMSNLTAHCDRASRLCDPREAHLPRHRPRQRRHGTAPGGHNRHQGTMRRTRPQLTNPCHWAVTSVPKSASSTSTPISMFRVCPRSVKFAEPISAR
jgi:hypothetical protein